MFDLVRTAIEKTLSYDTNITDYEKMENKYKINRRKLNLIILCLTLLVSINSFIAYFLTHNLVEYQMLILFSWFIFVLVAAVALGRKFPQQFGMLIMYITLPIFLSVILIKLYYEGFSIINLVLFIILLSFICLMYNSAYLYFREKLTMGEPVELTFVLSEETEPLEAKLITITKDGNYIVQPIGEDNIEISLNKDHIKKVIYNKASYS